jgi:hypothetical protein
MGIAEVDALEARRTSKDLPPVAAPPTRRSGVIRVPTPLPGAGHDGLDDDGSTPGPETLASVLEPTPAPQRMPARVPTPAPGPAPAAPAAQQPRAAAPAKAKAGKSFLIGMAIGIVILGAAVAVVIAKKSTTSPNPPQQPPAAATPTP